MSPMSDKLDFRDLIADALVRNIYVTDSAFIVMLCDRWRSNKSVVLSYYLAHHKKIYIANKLYILIPTRTNTTNYLNCKLREK